MAIDIGALATDRGTYLTYGWTYVSKDNPANASGTITSVEIWAAFTNLANCVVGTFYTTNGNTLKCRDSATIGAVTAGSKQTFTEDSEEEPLAIAVEAGDYIGIYFTTGYIEADNSEYAGVWYVSNEHIDPDDEATYDVYANYAMSLYGTGEEAVVGWTGKISGVTNPAKIMGVEVGNIAKVKGVE